MSLLIGDTRASIVAASRTEWRDRMSVYHSGNVPRFRVPSTSFEAPRNRWQDWINAIIGLWLIVAPSIMGQVGANEYAIPGISTNVMGIGVVLLAMCLWALARPAASAPEWISIVCGAWLVVTPWALGFAGMMGPETIADCVLGAVVLLTAISASRHTRRAIS
jgi:hypothetical protein